MKYRARIYYTKTDKALMWNFRHLHKIDIRFPLIKK